MLRIAICDDLAGERESLSRFLQGYFAAHPYAYALKEYSRGEELVYHYEDGGEAFDLIFLDIFMDGILGIETARRIRAFAPTVPIVFLTTTADYALESYDVQAYGYLLKPLETEKGSALLERFLREEQADRQKALLVREGGKSLRIPYREIEYIESDRNVLLIHLENGETHRIYAKLDDMERELSGHGFLRCHQSYIIHMDRVRAAERDFVMLSGARVPIRQRAAKSVRDAYFAYALSTVK